MLGKKWRSKNQIPNSIGNSQKLPFWKPQILFQKILSNKQVNFKKLQNGQIFFSALMTGAKVSWSDSPSFWSSLSLRSDSSACGRMNLSYIIQCVRVYMYILYIYIHVFICILCCVYCVYYRYIIIYLFYILTCMIIHVPTISGKWWEENLNLFAFQNIYTPQPKANV